MSEVIASALVVGGAALALVSAIGLHRFPDVFSRVHAAGKAAPPGALMVFVAVAIRLGDPGDIEKLLLAVLLLGITFPAGVHMVVRAAYRAGTELNPAIALDELAGRGAGSDAQVDGRGSSGRRGADDPSR